MALTRNQLARFRRLLDARWRALADEVREDVDKARLRASPSASRCAPCQTRHEKTYR